MLLSPSATITPSFRSELCIGLLKEPVLGTISFCIVSQYPYFCARQVNQVPQSLAMASKDQQGLQQSPTGSMKVSLTIHRLWSCLITSQQLFPRIVRILQFGSHNVQRIATAIQAIHPAGNLHIWAWYAIMSSGTFLLGNFRMIVSLWFV